ncbi:hypothetical protein Y71_13010 [Kosakonia radicincitans DSM 16656]|mgnify:CR=1 FL=1|uniref:Bacteriocin-type signal sequence-containing protein n=1 Tax=Kosakonia radicincitans TaxID=283686 RepID=A0AAX2EPD0_9ENTR|nr:MULTISPECIES: hypothetical protein [Kosakonia]MDP9566941.1 hypothetical protein [Kosakonia oryzae]APG18120.1 hypothetical protein A3780_11345 [Kosakonia radicincitans]ARD60794.1 hypothetical protein Y71_13010 [Kosakonia radicincitans DSM 16656]KDE38137.1 hypothetical protein AW40_01275 [Kosakonia radicincitans UMEnt01/12]MDD7998083.1 hypothetical protein [Kosakonia radicincitans]
MKELNSIEMREVSGAGMLSDAAGLLGSGIGAIVDMVMGGKSTAAADAGRNMAESIAGIVESGFGIINNIFNSIFGGLFGKKK